MNLAWHWTITNGIHLAQSKFHTIVMWHNHGIFRPWVGAITSYCWTENTSGYRRMDPEDGYVDAIVSFLFEMSSIALWLMNKPPYYSRKRKLRTLIHPVLEWGYHKTKQLCHMTDATYFRLPTRLVWVSNNIRNDKHAVASTDIRLLNTYCQYFWNTVCRVDDTY